VAVKAIRAAGIAVLVAAALTGCGHDSIKAVYAHPVPTCETLQAVVEKLGLPDPQIQPSALTSDETNRRDCTWDAGGKPATSGLGWASVLLIRPEVKFDEKKPATVFGDDFPADSSDCRGEGADNPQIPSGKSCSQLIGDHQALVTVTSYTKKSALRIDVRYSDPAITGRALQQATLAKANSLAQSTIDLL
jgi:hypothetical protein